MSAHSDSAGSERSILESAQLCYIVDVLNIPLVHWLVVVGVLVNALGAYAYIRDTFLGKTKPNRITWSMWALAPLIGVGAALSAEADVWATVRIFTAGFLPLLVFLASFFNRQSYWRLGPFDFTCGALSLVALIAWGAADSPRSAILLAALADCFAAIPTIVKAWRRPETETGSTFAASLISALLCVPSIPRWTIENSAFQIYLVAVNGLLVIVIYGGRWKRERASRRHGE